MILIHFEIKLAKIIDFFGNCMLNQLFIQLFHLFLFMLFCLISFLAFTLDDVFFKLFSFNWFEIYLIFTKKWLKLLPWNTPIRIFIKLNENIVDLRPLKLRIKNSNSVIKFIESKWNVNYWISFEPVFFLKSSSKAERSILDSCRYCRNLTTK